MQPEAQATQHVEIDPITAALMHLAEQGYTVVDMQLMTTRPAIKIEADPRLAQMVADQRACYYIQSARKRVGQFQLGGVRVIWVEEIAQ